MWKVVIYCSVWRFGTSCGGMNTLKIFQKTELWKWYLNLVSVIALWCHGKVTVTSHWDRRYHVIWRGWKVLMAFFKSFFKVRQRKFVKSQCDQKSGIFGAFCNGLDDQILPNRAVGQLFSSRKQDSYAASCCVTTFYRNQARSYSARYPDFCSFI